MTRFIILMAASVLSLGAFAGGQEHVEDKMKSSAAAFDSLDRNRDGQLSKSEAAADKSLADRFASLDTNGDGYLSKSEFAARTKT